MKTIEDYDLALKTAICIGVILFMLLAYFIGLYRAWRQIAKNKDLQLEDKQKMVDFLNSVIMKQFKTDANTKCIYTEAQVKKVVKDTVTETATGFMQWIKSETDIVDNFTGKQLITFLLETGFLNEDGNKHLSSIFEKLR